jgi:hypothetical protein
MLNQNIRLIGDLIYLRPGPISIFGWAASSKTISILDDTARNAQQQVY